MTSNSQQISDTAPKKEEKTEKGELQRYRTPNFKFLYKYQFLAQNLHLEPFFRAYYSII